VDIETSLDLERRCAGKEIFVSLSITDGPQAIQITLVGRQELMTRARKMRRLRSEVSGIVAIGCIDPAEDRQESRDVLGVAPVNDVEIDRRDGRAPENSGRHPDNDEVDLGRNQASENLNRIGGFHPEPGPAARIARTAQSSTDVRRA
jgi:hypothetical protein